MSITQFFPRVLPRVSHFEEIDGMSCLIRDDGQACIIVEIQCLDAEMTNLEAAETQLIGLIRSLPKGIRVRLIVDQERRGYWPFEHSRSLAISELGFYSQKVWISFESDRPIGITALAWGRARKFGGKSSALYGLRKSVNLEQLRAIGFSPRVLSEDEMREFFDLGDSEHVRTSYGVDSGTEVVGIIRLWRPGNNPLSTLSLASIREGLPPHRLSVSLTLEGSEKVEFLLRKKSRQESTSTDPIAAEKQQATEEALRNTLLHDQRLLRVEWILVFRRSSEKELREDLTQSLQVLRLFGDCIHETWGGVPSYTASFPGSTQHQSFTETEKNISVYLPWITRGQPMPKKAAPTRSLLLHRLDNSIEPWDIFDRRRNASNLLVVGPTGSGKSVFANLATVAWLNDPEIQIFKVDLGGSYVKECDIHRGRMFTFSPREPSGLNLFPTLDDYSKESHSSRELLSTFISCLSLEQEERFLSLQMKSEIEGCIESYYESKPKTPTLTDFVTKSKDLPRAELLRRWTKGGVYENAFAPRPELSQQLERYTLINLKGLEGASNVEYAQGVFAGVIGRFNSELLRLGDVTSGRGKRVVFICDETPVFIRRNGEFFKLTCANVRKFGHATLLLAQSIRDFVLPSLNGRDTGILDNSPNRVFYDYDTALSELAPSLGLDSMDLGQMRSLERGVGYREAFIQDPLGKRIVRLILTQEEYWRVTSSLTDNQKYQKLRRAVPELTAEEAIRCLSRG